MKSWKYVDIIYESGIENEKPYMMKLLIDIVVLPNGDINFHIVTK